MDEINAGNEGFDFQAELAKAEFGQLIADYANTPIREGADKYGYIFIDPVGTLCEKQHPSYAGHRFIADLVLEALPDGAFPYTDVERTSKNYRAVEYMWKKGIMDGATETTFAPAKNLTKADLSKAMAVITGAEATNDSTVDAMRIELIASILGANPEATFIDQIKTLAYAVKIFMNDYKFNFLSPVTREEAAKILFDYINL